MLLIHGLQSVLSFNIMIIQDVLLENETGKQNAILKNKFVIRIHYCQKMPTSLSPCVCDL